MKPSILLNTANWSMGVTLALSTIIIYVIYIRDLGLSIPVLVTLHILFIIMAAIFKVSYVARLTALRRMNKLAH